MSVKPESANCHVKAYDILKHHQILTLWQAPCAISELSGKHVFPNQGGEGISCSCCVPGAAFRSTLKTTSPYLVV